MYLHVTPPWLANDEKYLVVCETTAMCTRTHIPLGMPAKLEMENKRDCLQRWASTMQSACILDGLSNMPRPLSRMDYLLLWVGNVRSFSISGHADAVSARITWLSPASQLCTVFGYGRVGNSARDMLSSIFVGQANTSCIGAVAKHCLFLDTSEKQRSNINFLLSGFYIVYTLR